MASFLEALDDEGRQLYKDYIASLTKWIAYMRPKAIKKLNDYLDSKGKLYNKYEYLSKEYNTSAEKVVNVNNKELNAKYKKLSLLLHPDKFRNSHSTELFALINKFYCNGNGFMINMIDAISQYILEETNNPDVENIIGNIIINLENPDIENIIIRNIGKDIVNDTNAHDVFNMLISKSEDIANFGNGNGNDGSKNRSECSSDDISNNEKFIFSTEYIFYKGNASTVKCINDMFLTEEELIEKIKNANTYEKSFVNFCAERYASNGNILRATCEWLSKINENLKKENQEMQKAIQKLSTK
jgi:hypothetical protein